MTRAAGRVHRSVRPLARRTASAAARAVAAGLLLSFGLLPAAQAEVWGYVDSAGVAHFAPEKMDDRYELFFRGGENFDTSEGLRSPRPGPLPAPAHKLMAFFEVSPGYRKVKQHLREASRAQDVDYELLKALIVTESGFDSGAVSPKGAIGLMQIMPATAERYGVTGDTRVPLHKKLADPRTNIRTGVRYLRYLIDLFPGRLDLALAAYNAGEGAVQRAGNRIPNFRETQNYVKTVMQLYGMLKPGAAQSGSLVGRLPGRVRMQLPGAAQASVYTPAMTMGAAANRGSLPSQPSRPSRPSQPSTLSTASPGPSLAAAQNESRPERD